VNTLTNLLFAYLAYEGIKSCRKHGHDTVFTVAYFGYFLVGFGSFMFHTTLKCEPTGPPPLNLLTFGWVDPWQLVDELNMIYTTCLMAYASISYSRSPTTQLWLGIFFTFLCVFITLYYHHLQDPTFHQNVYAALTLFIVVRSVYSMETTLRPRWRKTREQDRILKEKRGLPVLTREQQEYENQRDLDILKSMWKLVAFGVSVFLLGFGIWSLDNKYCSTLRTWRRSIGMPWGFFLEGHGWWHLMTGVGAYCYIIWGIWLRHILNGHRERYTLIWPKIYQIPEIVRMTDSPIGNGQVSAANGSLKKSN